MPFRTESTEFFLIRSDQNDRNRSESDLKIGPISAIQIGKNSEQIPSGSAQIQWVTGKTSVLPKESKILWDNKENLPLSMPWRHLPIPSAPVTENVSGRNPVPARASLTIKPMTPNLTKARTRLLETPTPITTTRTTKITSPANHRPLPVPLTPHR